VRIVEQISRLVALLKGEEAEGEEEEEAVNDNDAALSRYSGVERRCLFTHWVRSVYVT
jgi:hypothetical protein